MGGMNLDLLDLDLTRLENNTILELREFAKQLGLKSVTKYRKAQLIELIQAKLTEMSEEQGEISQETGEPTESLPKKEDAKEPQPDQLKIEDIEDAKREQDDSVVSSEKRWEDEHETDDIREIDEEPEQDD